MRLLVLGAIVSLVVVEAVHADLENQQHGEGGVFTSKELGVRIVVPRGWHATDAPSYPGVVLWMMRGDNRIVLTAERLTCELYTSWPVQCRTSHDFTSMTAKAACALQGKLGARRLHVGILQAGPKENEEAGLPSVWFDYDDGSGRGAARHFVRQAVAIGENRVISLVLSTSTNEARTSNLRAFEQALRSLNLASSEELHPDGGVGATVPSAPNPNPVSPCP
jgi:hypothetical protein